MMQRLAEYVLTQALPYTFRVYGFKLYQEDRDTFLLEHEGDVVDRFNADVEVLTLVNDCRDHLVRCHGYDRNAI